MASENVSPFSSLFRRSIRTLASVGGEVRAIESIARRSGNPLWSNPESTRVNLLANFELLRASSLALSVFEDSRNQPRECTSRVRSSLSSESKVPDRIRPLESIAWKTTLDNDHQLTMSEAVPVPPITPSDPYDCKSKPRVFTVPGAV